MPRTSHKSPSLKISIKLESDRASLRMNHESISQLRGKLAQMSYLSDEKITEIKIDDENTSRTTFGTRFPETLIRGFWFSIAPERLRATIRAICNWLDEFHVNTFVEIEIPPNQDFFIDQRDAQYNSHLKSASPPSARFVRLFTKTSEELAEVIVLVEAMLPKEHTYLHQAQKYVEEFGELTPAARSNLNLFGYTLKLSREETQSLNNRALGRYRKLEEKYNYYSMELLKTSSEEVTQDFLIAMRDRAQIIQLPELDAIYLEEKSRIIQESMKVYKEESQKQNNASRQGQFEAYQTILRNTMLNNKSLKHLSQDVVFLLICYGLVDYLNIRILFFKCILLRIKNEFITRRSIFESNSNIVFNKKQIEEARNKLGISAKDADLLAEILVENDGLKTFEIFRKDPSLHL